MARLICNFSPFFALIFVQLAYGVKLYKLFFQLMAILVQGINEHIGKEVGIIIESDIFFEKMKTKYIL